MLTGQKIGRVEIAAVETDVRIAAAVDPAALILADELQREALERRLGLGFPLGYEVRIGDVVRRADGVEFEVRRFTADGQGVELEGRRQPVVLYVEREQVAAEFTALVERRR